jgi:hypothetical protein
MNVNESASVRLCPLCNEFAEYAGWAHDGSRMFQVSCARCGKFKISEQALETLKKDEKHLLSAVCRMWQDPEIPRILAKDIQGLIQRAPQWGLAEKMDRLLDMIARETSELGSLSKFDPNVDYPLMVLRSKQEAIYLIQELADRHYVKYTAAGVMLKTAGWERLEEIRRSGHESRQAFVAMWFDKSRDSIYSDGIEPAIREAGYTAVRIDKSETLNRIDDEIISQLRQSRYLVCDFTGQRAGVYFEAGFILGLGRNVYWMCEKSELKDVHFDTRQYNFIDYETVEEAKKRLYDRIMANEGKGEGPETENS